ncbi:MAG TPA: styrene monooxygenase/indole monooxygenase family protein [Thermomicrobiales bacterium]|nr:styrene monooxygenase/indole monooxygenase family protein [Thermomicrobiales bacterium]
MTSIGIVGSGIAGLHLGLFLQQRGIPATLYSDRTPEQLRAGRLPNSVARFEHTRARERALGVAHWDTPDFGMFCAHFRINGEPPLTFRGDLSRPASFVDMRLYLPALLEDFAARGGRVEIGALDANDVARLARGHDLLVVASGRASLTELFPRRPERSPYTAPQRRLCCGLFRGIAYPQPLGLSFNIAPGHGEVFQAPFLSAAGRVSSLLFEAIPGGELEPITRLRYDDDPRRFEALVLALLRDHAPAIYERVDPAAFGLLGPLDLLQGAITPTVRRGYAPLDGDTYAVAVGDVHVLNDPVLGQGANTASHAAWVLGEAIAAGGPFDAGFCRDVEGRIWEYARPVTEWTNASLQPPAPHAVELFVAAARDQAIADELVDNFNAPRRNWALFGSPDGAAAYLQRFAAAAR